MNAKIGVNFVIFWSVYNGQPKVLRIILSKNFKTFPNPVILSCSKINKLANQVTAVLAGKNIRFALGMLRFDLCPVFQQKVLRAAAAIPRGKVRSYQFIAKYIGKPKAARAVGRALANNPFPIVIPCHRVIRSDGALGGYQGGLKMKKYLLNSELEQLN
ncbi:MAG: MGMT family protein [Candidatus Omnitrophota bacterium]